MKYFLIFLIFFLSACSDKFKRENPECTDPDPLQNIDVFGTDRSKWKVLECGLDIIYDIIGPPLSGITGIKLIKKAKILKRPTIKQMKAMENYKKDDGLSKEIKEKLRQNQLEVEKIKKNREKHTIKN